mmetsp:Transcript_47988/g.127109  ORF Transcript_47988/g.127109 Transcript_47988/m.127109 type:complete len:256 (+) Transcript_47988:867-1634(+)
MHPRDLKGQETIRIGQLQSRCLSRCLFATISLQPELVHDTSRKPHSLWCTVSKNEKDIRSPHPCSQSTSRKGHLAWPARSEQALSGENLRIRAREKNFNSTSVIHCSSNFTRRPAATTVLFVVPTRRSVQDFCKCIKLLIASSRPVWDPSDTFFSPMSPKCSYAFPSALISRVSDTGSIFFIVWLTMCRSLSLTSATSAGSHSSHCPDCTLGSRPRPVKCFNRTCRTLRNVLVSFISLSSVLSSFRHSGSRYSHP